MTVLRDLTGGRVYPLRGKIMLIGRDPHCDIVVRDSHASAEHALLIKCGGSWYIEDLESANGTFVNGTRIRQRTVLKTNDRLEMYGLKVMLEEGGRSTPAPEPLGLMTHSGPGSVPAVMSSLDVGRLQAEVDAESKLRAILEVSRALGATLQLQDVLPKILESLFAVFPQADRGFILLHDANTGQLVPRAVRGRAGQPGPAPEVSQTLIDHALQTRRAILSADTGLDERFDLSKSIQQLQIRSVMCIPLLGQADTPLGVLQIDTQDSANPFREEDLDVLVSASTQAARAVELARLHEELRDLSAATQIQKSFLPAERPQAAGLQFFDYYAPARQVGGDYYDYISLPGNRLAVTLGDVSGKGVSAALLMARLSSAVRFCLASTATVPEAVRQLSALLTRAGTEDRFITFVVAVLDLARFTITLVNAGHMAPVRRRAGKREVEEIAAETIGLPLGVFDRPYEQAVLTLEPGDTLVLYTDGVTEARDPAGDLFGPERLQKALANAPPEVEGLGNAVLAEVNRFTAGRPPADDLALVCFGRQ
jgi:serine phosphatase RsbU (regulator of sigma subunit)